MKKNCSKPGMIERVAYSIYFKKNSKRKAKQPTNRVFRAIDNIRRVCGFVK